MKKCAIILCLTAALSVLPACGVETEDQSETQSPEPAVTIESSFLENAESNNPLLLADFLTDTVHSGSGKDIGTYGYVEVKKELFPDFSTEEFSANLTEFADTKVRDSGYNWVSIIFDDGTGFCFTGSNTIVADYGTVDEEGCITTSLGTCIRSPEGFEYEKNLVQSIPNPTLLQEALVPDNSYNPVEEIIFSTTATENGFGDTPFYAEGMIEEFFDVKGYNTIRLSTNYGDLYISEVLIPFPEMEIGDHVTMFFVYGGWSDVIDGPSGTYIHHE